MTSTAVASVLFSSSTGLELRAFALSLSKDFRGDSLVSLTPEARACVAYAMRSATISWAAMYVDTRKSILRVAHSYADDAVSDEYTAEKIRAVMARGAA